MIFPAIDQAVKHSMGHREGRCCGPCPGDGPDSPEWRGDGVPSAMGRLGQMFPIPPSLTPPELPEFTSPETPEGPFVDESYLRVRVVDKAGKPMSGIDVEADLRGLALVNEVTGTTGGDGTALLHLPVKPLTRVAVAAMLPEGPQILTADTYPDAAGAPAVTFQSILQLSRPIVDTTEIVGGVLGLAGLLFGIFGKAPVFSWVGGGLLTASAFHAGARHLQE